MPICLYSCRPNRRVGAAIAVAVFFFCAAMAFSAVGLNNQLRRMFNLTALLMLLICFLVVKRFLATSYSYAVYLGEGTDLVIHEHTLADSEPRVVTRISLSEITEVRVVHNKKDKKDKKDKKKDRKKGKPSVRYNYSVSAFEKDHIVIICADGDKAYGLKLTYDERLPGVIEKYR